MPLETEPKYGAWGAVGLETVRHNWGWFLAVGIAFVLLGIAAIIVPQLVSVAAAILAGWVLLIAGIAQIINAFWSRDWGGFLLALLAGAVYAFVGLLLLIYPVIGVVGLTLLLGMFFLTAGALKIAMAFALHPLPSWGLVLASGIVSLVIAFLILANWPSSAVWAIGVLVGIDLLATGVAMITVALPARRALRS